MIKCTEYNLHEMLKKGTGTTDIFPKSCHFSISYVLFMQVFGAYCSSKWGERNLKDDRGNRQAYFGTGETFLFSLYPERAKYPWVGMDGDKNLGHGAELFMAADSKMITIGGG